MAEYYSRYTGVIKLFAGAFVPKGWLPCEGQLLLINEYRELYSILGTVYGGNGTTTFALPDLRGRVAVGAGQGNRVKGYQAGETGGEETVRLLPGDLPAHKHRFHASSHPADQRDPAGAVWGKEAQGITFLYSDAKADTTMRSSAVSTTGGERGNESVPHENMQPFLVVRYIIAVQGMELPEHP